MIYFRSNRHDGYSPSDDEYIFDNFKLDGPRIIIAQKKDIDILKKIKLLRNSTLFHCLEADVVMKQINEGITMRYIKLYSAKYNTNMLQWYSKFESIPKSSRE